MKLKLPWREPDFETDWARIVAPMAGGGRGAVFLPEVGDEVLVAFDRDDIRYPYVLGALWSKTDKPPEARMRQEERRPHHQVAQGPLPEASTTARRRAHH